MGYDDRSGGHRGASRWPADRRQPAGAQGHWSRPRVDEGERQFLIDFSPTGYIDSSGLGALVSISKRVREAGGELRLAGLNEDLRSLFELTKLDTLFAIYPGVEEALQGF